MNTRALGLFLFLTGAVGPRLSFADDWAWPEPVSFCCRGFGFVAEIFPPKTRQNDSDRPACYFYRMGYPGTTWKVDATLVWKAELVNDVKPFTMPYEAIVSMDGYLVTLNDYARMGGKHAIVIYDPKGKLVKSYALDQLLPKEDAQLIPASMSGRWWNEKATYFFLEKPDRLYIVLALGKTMEFGLEDGAFKYDQANAFPDLAPLLVKPHANERTEIWRTNLRFSSVTDILAAKAGRPPYGELQPLAPDRGK